MSSLEGDGRWEECSRERKKMTRATAHDKKLFFSDERKQRENSFGDINIPVVTTS